MGDPIDLDHIERLLAEATPGPWTADGPMVASDIDTPDEVLLCDCAVYGQRRKDDADAALIAALVTAAPAMVAEIRRLREENGRLRHRVPAAVHVSISTAEMQDMIDKAVAESARVAEGEVARAREKGRAEERAAIVAWLLDEGHAFASEDIERGKHREEDDNG